MSTEREPYEPGGPGVTPNDFEDVVAEGDLFIRDLAPTASGDDEGYDEDDDGIVTTQMLGEEGDRGGEKEKKEKKDKGRPDDGIVTTMALGEEGERAGR